MKNTPKKQLKAEDLSCRNKRQRIATERLYELARETNIELLKYAVAQPYYFSISIDDANCVDKYTYAIQSADQQIWLVWDMVSGSTWVLPNDKSVVCVPLNVVEMLGRGTQATIAIDYIFEVNFCLTLEVMSRKEFFVAQRELTEELKEYADSENLAHQANARAKLATYKGSIVWSMPVVKTTIDESGVEVERSGFALYYLLDRGESYDFVYDGDGDVVVWVLQQRVAVQLVQEFANENKFFCSKTPCLAMLYGNVVWAAAVEDENDDFIVVDVKTRKSELLSRRHITFNKDGMDAQKSYQPFLLNIDGIVLKAMPWLEFSIAKN